MLKPDLADATATELLSLYRSKQVSPVEATQAALNRIDQRNAKLNAYCLVDHATDLRSPRASGPRWLRVPPLDRGSTA